MYSGFNVFCIGMQKNLQGLWKNLQGLPFLLQGLQIFIKSAEKDMSPPMVVA